MHNESFECRYAVVSMKHDVERIKKRELEKKDQNP
jgi:hypothetical protein